MFGKKSRKLKKYRRKVMMRSTRDELRLSYILNYANIKDLVVLKNDPTSSEKVVKCATRRLNFLRTKTKEHKPSAFKLVIATYPSNYDDLNTDIDYNDIGYFKTRGDAIIFASKYFNVLRDNSKLEIIPSYRRKVKYIEFA